MRGVFWGHEGCRLGLPTKERSWGFGGSLSIGLQPTMCLIPLGSEETGGPRPSEEAHDGLWGGLPGVSGVSHVVSVLPGALVSSLMNPGEIGDWGGN